MNKKIILGVTIFLYLPSIQASVWDNLWSRPDEQAAKLLSHGKIKQAAEKFENLPWRGIANYRSGQYEQAFKDFSGDKTAQGYYNSGNSLARMGQYQAAIDSYNKALELNAHNEDAKYNRDLLGKLLKQQKQKQQQQQSDQQNQQQSKNNDQQQKNKQQSSQQQNQAQKQQQQRQHGQTEQRQQQSQSERDKNNKQQTRKKQQQQASKQTKPQQPPQGRSKDKPQQMTEQQRSMKQWLKRIPDNPGGLLRQKFMRDHMRMQQLRQRIAS